MKFSAWLNLANPWPDVLAAAGHVEKTGWDGLWLADHFMPANRQADLAPVQECWTALAALAASTSRIRVGTLVSGNTYRNPGVLAKQAAQVDVISGGRLVLGLGAGWQENEHEAYDIPFYTVGGRLRRLEESVQVIRSLLDNERTNFEGRYYRFKDAPLAPKPLQARLPILIGGGGEQVTLRIVAKHADEWNTWGPPETLARKGDILSRYMQEAGRDPASIKRTAQVVIMLSEDKAAVEKAKASSRFPLLAGSAAELQEVIARYAEAGLDELIVPNFLAASLAECAEFYDRFLEDVAAPFR